MELKKLIVFLLLLSISIVEILLKKITTWVLSFVGLCHPKQTQASTKLQTTSPRIKLKDGRYLAYRERGVPINKSIHRIILVHGLHSSKDVNFLATQEILEEMGIYMVQYDRAGYGESDQNKKRSVESEGCDIEELADQLQIGSKFYIISVSAGSYPSWNCIRRIPLRLKGVAFISPIINYKWDSLPRDLIKNDHANKLWQIVIWFSRYAPGLFYTFCTQKLNSVYSRTASLFTKKGIQVAENANKLQGFDLKLYPTQSDFESLLQDFSVAHGKWDFDPLEFVNPFPGNESSVHIWHGYMDDIVPSSLQRYVSERLPWIHYHEVGDGVHDLWHVGQVGEAILRSFLLGEEDPIPHTICRWF